MLATCVNICNVLWLDNFIFFKIWSQAEAMDISFECKIKQHLSIYWLFNLLVTVLEGFYCTNGYQTSVFN